VSAVPAILALGLGLAAPAVPPAPPSEADPIAFRAHADKARVKLGEPFGYRVEIRHVPDERYLLRGEPALAPFRAEDVRCRREVEGREARTTCTLRLALFALGEVDVPDLVFEVDRPDGKARLAVPGPRVTGVGLLDPTIPPEQIPLRPPAPPAPLLVPTLLPLAWAAAALAGVALAAGAAIALRRRGTRRPTAPALSPDERFARRLAALEDEHLPRLGRGEEHVLRLSEAVREYLGALTGLPAVELTTAELLAALAHAPDPRLDAAGLARFLDGADRVKFARQPADPELCAAATAFARALLSQTRPPSVAQG
jgi:hypothetical protein